MRPMPLSPPLDPLSSSPGSAAIEAIAGDNLALKQQLVLENRASGAPTSSAAAALITELRGQADTYTVKVRGTGARVGAPTATRALRAAQHTLTAPHSHPCMRHRSPRCSGTGTSSSIRLLCCASALRSSGSSWAASARRRSKSCRWGGAGWTARIRHD